MDRFAASSNIGTSDWKPYKLLSPRFRSKEFRVNKRNGGFHADKQNRRARGYFSHTWEAFPHSWRGPPSSLSSSAGEPREVHLRATKRTSPEKANKYKRIAKRTFRIFCYFWSHFGIERTLQKELPSIKEITRWNIIFRSVLEHGNSSGMIFQNWLVCQTVLWYLFSVALSVKASILPALHPFYASPSRNSRSEQSSNSRLYRESRQCEMHSLCLIETAVLLFPSIFIFLSSRMLNPSSQTATDCRDTRYTYRQWISTLRKNWLDKFELWISLGFDEFDNNLSWEFF